MLDFSISMRDPSKYWSIRHCFKIYVKLYDLFIQDFVGKVLITLIPIESISFGVASQWLSLFGHHPRFHLWKDTSNGSWRQGIKGEMTCTVYVELVWDIIY